MLPYKIYYVILPVGYTDNDLSELHKILRNKELREDYIYQRPKQIFNYIKNTLKENMDDYQICEIKQFSETEFWFSHFKEEV